MTSRISKRSQFNGHALAVVVMLFSSLFPMTATGDPTSQVFQLTSGPDADGSPDVSGTTYVWRRRVGNSGDIYRWTEGDANPVKISETEWSNGAQISEGRVVWWGRTSYFSDQEIKLWEDGVVTLLTDNTDDDFGAVIGGSGIVWIGRFGLVHFDGITQTPIPVAADYQQNAAVMDGMVVWQGDPSGPGGDEIFHWQDGITTRLTTNTFNDRKPATDGTTVVWQANEHSGEQSEIWRWTLAGGIVRLTNNSVYDYAPDVSGDVVVFTRFIDADAEIFFRYLGVDYQITDNNFKDSAPRIDGDRVVWHGFDAGGPHIYYAILSGLEPGEIVGGCCFDLDCQMLTMTECNAASGIFNGIKTFCDVDACGVEPAGGWSTAHHDYQRTGRTTAVVQGVPNPIWRRFRDYSRVAPVIGPDGTIYASNAPDHFLALNPDGSLRWQVRMGADGPSPAIRRDGHLWVPSRETIGKVDPQDGGGLCGLPSRLVSAPAMDPAGNVYFAGKYGSQHFVRKIDPSCGLQWTHLSSTGRGFTSHIAIGDDGGLHVSAGIYSIKIDPDDGTAIWVKPAHSSVGEPAIGPDGTIYRTMGDDKLFAMNPDGSEKWSHTFDDPDFLALSSSPAIGADGSVYVNGIPGINRDGSVGLVAVSAAGVELWPNVDTSAFSTGYSPAIDGEGKLLISSARDVIAVDSLTGTELWRVAVGIDDDDHLIASPTIDETGSVYVTSYDGWLVALGNGCPEAVNLVGPYTYRQVAYEGETTASSSIGVRSLEALELRDNGLVTFQTSDVVAIEESPGSFRTITRGSIIDGKELDSVEMPREDANGSVYIRAGATDIGQVVFVDDVLTMREDRAGGVLTRVSVAEFTDAFFDIVDGAIEFLFFGRDIPNSDESVWSVRYPNGRPYPLVSLGTEVDGFASFSFDMDSRNRRQVNSGGSWILASEQGIVVDGNIVLRSADIIGGFGVREPAMPQINLTGAVHFWASLPLENDGVFSLTERRVGTNDVVDGFTIRNVHRFDVNDSDALSFTATMLGGAVGVFSQNLAIAVSNATLIGGDLVESVDQREFDQNNSGQVAFVATVAGSKRLYVATENGTAPPAFTYREVFRVGETVNGIAISDIFSLNLSDGGLTAVRLEGIVDGGSTDHALLYETSEGVFERVVTNDTIAGLTILMSSSDHAPRIDDDSNVYLLCYTLEVGTTLFRNGIPLVQRNVAGATAPVLMESWQTQDRIFDVSDNDRVLQYGRPVGEPSAGLVVVDALSGTAQVAWRLGGAVPGWTIDSIDLGREDERHRGNNDRTFVIRGQGHVAVTRDQYIHVRNGHVSGGIQLNDFSSPQANQGNIVFIATFAGGNGIFDVTRKIVATGDTVSGFVIDNILAHSTSNGTSSYTARLDTQAVGVFRGTAAVAVEGMTTISGQLVQAIQQDVVRKNYADQVAFVATTTIDPLTLFVASGADDALAFRNVAAVGEFIDGHEVLSIHDVRLSEDGLVAFRSSDTPKTTVLFREVAEGVFTTIAHGDPMGMFTVDMTMGHAFTPRVNASGDVLMCIPVDPGGSMVFVNGEPYASQTYTWPPFPMVIDRFGSNKYIDHDESGRFLTINEQNGFSDELILADTNTNTLTVLVTGRDVIDGFSVQGFEPARVDGFADDGVPVFLAYDGFGGSAIMTPSTIIARSGDIVDGWKLNAPKQPRRDAQGNIYYLDSGNLFYHSVGGQSSMLIGQGDVVLNRQVVSIDDFALNPAGDFAYRASLAVNSTAVIFNGSPVAFAPEGEINGLSITDVDTVPFTDSVNASDFINAAGQIAFRAEVDGRWRLYVATPRLDFDFDGNGAVDTLDFAVFDSCLTGPDAMIGAECATSDADGDCDVDILDFARFQVAVTDP